MKICIALLLVLLPSIVVGLPPLIYEVTVTVTNEAEEGGTCLTPVWFGVHTGSFDIYDSGAPADEALERIAEDGNAAPLSEQFLATDTAVLDGLIGSEPICPGDIVERSFVINVKRTFGPLYFSYVSMVLPSNDAFIANANPVSHLMFDERGRFVGRPQFSFNVEGSEVNDAGTEVNDELPETTAFFGQAVADSGEEENGVIVNHEGFKAAREGGILASPNFPAADFTSPGYTVMSVSARSPRSPPNARANLNGRNLEPIVDTRGKARLTLRFLETGDIQYRFRITRLDTPALSAQLFIGATFASGVSVFDFLADADTDRGSSHSISGNVNRGKFTLNGLISEGQLDGVTNEELWFEVRRVNAFATVFTQKFGNEAPELSGLLPKRNP